MHFSLSRALRLTAAALTLHTAPFTLSSSAQRPPAQPNAAEILHRMQKLNVLGSVLYIVAHPDDENTRLITWLANGKKVRTGNLSLTRGDGGQNLIGPELGDALGIIRTQELLEARRIDGGEQFFTRAVDFGFSKTADESFEKWGKQEVLSDVVRVIRQFRPDIIITRFSHIPGGTHGHHTASAILAHEAFDLAGDPKAFPEQLKAGLEPWQPRRLFHNGSSWWRKDLDEVAKTDPDWFTVDVGGYDPLLGLSYTEIAGRSRSMHKSQGFGAAETRGEAIEYLHLEKGDRPKGKDIFEGIDMTWGRVNAPKEIILKSGLLVSNFDVNFPEKSFDALHGLDRRIASWVNDNNPTHDQWRWGQIKSDAINDLASACLGVSFDALSNKSYSSTSDTIEVQITGFPRIRRELFLSTYGWSSGVDWDRHSFGSKDIRLIDRIDTTLRVVHQSVTEPFWLERPHGTLYQTPSGHANIIPVMIPEPYVAVAFNPELDTTDYSHFHVSGGIMHKWVDRVAGERIRPVYVTPVASVIPKANNLIARGGTQVIEVEVEALTDSLTGQLNVTLPEGWGTTKDIKRVHIAQRNERQLFTFQLMPSANAKPGAARFEFVGPKGKADRTLHEIDYPHIMPQVYYTPAEVKLVPLDPAEAGQGVKTTAKTVGYIKGAGDDVPQAIEQLGVKVDIIDPATATLQSLKGYDAIVVGIRAYNTVKPLKELNPVLKQYVQEGGTLVVQYNTTPSFGASGVRDMVVDPPTLGPYPFKITRDRVTVEEAPPTFLDPKHPLLNTPNKITAADFDGWVQERGLYFLGELDPHYTPLIAWNDPGEQPLNGGLVTCDYGKGRYVYTGISFFRQLPAGVPGAYRLFANLISPRNVR